MLDHKAVEGRRDNRGGRDAKVGHGWSGREVPQYEAGNFFIIQIEKIENKENREKNKSTIKMSYEFYQEIKSYTKKLFDEEMKRRETG